MSLQMRVTWVLESQVHSKTHAVLRESIRRAGDAVVEWNDDWWATQDWPEIVNSAVVFHGSLENAAKIRQELPWQPGAYCDVSAFRCSAWYPRAQQWLLNTRWRMLAANDLVKNSAEVLEALNCQEQLFVRPDSPLKPFAGRVLVRHRITLESLDYGFYFDDASIPVIAAPVRAIRSEWRYVIVKRRVAAGSAYKADGRLALPDNPRGESWASASRIASELQLPEDVYVMDICDADGDLRLLELNPFSGADLYACDTDDIVTAIDEVVRDARRR